MKKTKIDWCDCTINFVIGCKNSCKYCYARKINQRFGFVKNWEEPQFFPERIKQLNSKAPKSIFMDSMSDIGYWTFEQLDKTIEAIRKNPQHSYIFLTKCNITNVIESFKDRIDLSVYPIYIGKTITKQKQAGEIISNDEKPDFLSIEPILEPIRLGASLNKRYNIKQVILGAETGNRKGKVIPKKEWIDSIVKECDEANVRVFMKESLRKIMGNDFRQDELIWKVN